MQKQRQSNPPKTPPPDFGLSFVLPVPNLTHTVLDKLV